MTAANPTEHDDPVSSLRARIAQVSAPPMSDAAKHLLDALLEKFPTSAALFYGSGASVSSHEDPTNIIFDFYIIGPSYDALYASGMLGLANKIMPPNVFYFETPSPDGTLRAKYAVLTIDHFERLVSTKTFHSYFWARFAQPCRIYDPNNQMHDRLENALAQSIISFCANAVGLVGKSFTAKELWLAGLNASYKAELRAEDSDRAGKLIESYGDWAATVTAPALRAAGYSVTKENDKITIGETPKPADLSWRMRAMAGAGLSVARLLKGTQTFNGGIDYIAWKIKRHSGIDIGVTEWERKHPLLGAPGAGLRYYRLRAKQKNT
ncbi:hypothetical protein [Hyphococcus sp. DH-69]|uniref:hypothetical protein n=1 Tax=Hyphococcus formosus TaxID=3143534 RepID=UPI00398AC0D6